MKTHAVQLLLLFLLLLLRLLLLLGSAVTTLAALAGIAKQVRVRVLSLDVILSCV